MKSAKRGAPARRKAQHAPVPADLVPPDSQWPPVPDRVLRSSPNALPVGHGLAQLAASVPDGERWRGDARMLGPIAASVVANRHRFQVFGLHVVAASDDGVDVPVQIGQRLQPSPKRDEFGDVIDGGLHRGVAACGFRDRPGLAAAIEAIAWEDGRQVALIGGAGALRCDERDRVVILAAVVIKIWFRRYAGLGRIYGGLDHADFD